MTQYFTVPFPFLQPSDIHVCAIDHETRRKGTEIPIIGFMGGGVAQVMPQNVPAQGQSFMIYRETPRDAPLIDFSNGQILTAEELDEAFLQNLYICEEILDELGWQSNEISLLWTAYNTLNASHQSLAALVSQLRTKLEATTETANRAFNIASDIRCWLKPWFDNFLPAISRFINIDVLDGGNAGTINEIYCIIDGNIDPDEYETATIYDGGSSADYKGYAWTPEAIKLMYAYDYAEIALANAKKALPIACRALKAAKYLHNHEPFILDAGGVLEMMEFIQ